MTNSNELEPKEEILPNESESLLNRKKIPEEIEKVKFNKLTPIDSSPMHIYKEGLDFAFENNDIRNIAITGPYGAGKTSLINSYKKLNPNKVFKHISLAHFQPEEDIEETGIEKNQEEEGRVEKEKPENKSSKHFLNENLLEAKILNQLLHQVDSKKIPKTNFKIKEKIPHIKILINILLLLILGICCLFLIFYDSWVAYTLEFSDSLIRDWLNKTTTPTLRLVAGAVSILITTKYLYHLFIIQNNRNIFKKLNLQGNQIEILEESKDSYFDKYLNEVLYVFDNSGADAIIFEDIDRYSANQIFGKLREINTLVNNKRDKVQKENNPLRFIFSLRDDVFISKDRTKFFDFILPVVPVLDGSNSYEQFLQEFKREVQEEKLDTKFLQGISLYVDDMRILKNIYNEFLVYKKRLNTIELDLNKLLALVTYKNIFPRDFSELQLNSGFVFHLFNQKDEFVKEQTIAIDNEITEKEILLSQIQKEEVKSIEELDSIYFQTSHRFHTVGAKPIESFKSRVELVKALRENAKSVTTIRNNHYHEQTNLEANFKALENNPEYVERKKVIQSKNSLEKERINLEIMQLKESKNSFVNKKLQSIITRENIDSIFKSTYKDEIGTENKFEEIKGSPYFLLIKFLIRNGYIDETYPDYMTYFYATSISIGDKIFLRSISDESAKEYSYALKNPQLIISRLDITDFQKREILNFDLLKYLLTISESHTFYLETFMNQLLESKKFDFIEQFLALKTNKKSFISSLNAFWPHFFEDVILNSNYQEPLKKLIALDILIHSQEDELKLINKKFYLSEYISNNKDFLNIENPETAKIIERLILLNVCFTDIDLESSNKMLINEVYKKNLFKLNFLMINKFLKLVYNIENENSLSHKNYSLIMSRKNESLYEYVNKNIQEYLEVILDNCEEKITDEQPAILELLKNKDIEFDTKIKYINFLVNKVEDLDEIDEVRLWPTALADSIISIEAPNALSYFFKSGNGLDSYLVGFINEFDLGLSFEPDFLNANFGEDAAEKLFDAVIQENTLANKQFKSILSSFSWQNDEFTVDGIESEKVLILVELGIISMSEENLTFVREQYYELQEQFIIKNIEDYLELLNPEIFRLDDALFLLESSISIPQKLAALEHNESEISLREKRLATEIKGYIIENHFDLKDFQFLLDNYSHEKRQIQEKIIELISEQFSYVIKEKLSIAFNVLKEIYLHKQLSEQQNKQLLALNLKNFDPNEAYQLFTILNSKEYLSLFERGRPKIPKTDIDKQLLDVLQSKNWISYSVDKNEPTYFRANSKKAINRHSM